MSLSRRSLFALFGALALAPAAADPEFGPSTIRCTERMLEPVGDFSGTFGCVNRNASVIWPGIGRWWSRHYDPLPYEELSNV